MKRIHPSTDRTSTPNHWRPRRLAQALEPRLLFDGAGFMTLAETSQPDHHDPAHAEVPPAAPAIDPAGDAPAAGREVLLIDPTVSDARALAEAARPGVEVKWLDPQQPIADQVLAAVRDGAPVDSLSIVSHGGPGALVIGGQAVDAAGLAGAGATWAEVGEHLTADADILLYGCDVGAGTAGAAFVQELASLTGADVAASSDATGPTALGADWTLELHTGPIDALSPFAIDRVAGLSSWLAAPSVTASTDAATVLEPSVLNAPGASSYTLTGWTISDDGIGSPNVSVDVVVGSTAVGTLSNPGGSLGGTVTAIAGGYRYVGTPGGAETWVNQLVFTAADAELGKSAATTSVTVTVTDGEAVPLSVARAISLTVTPSNDPTVLPDGNLAVVEGSPGTVVTALALAAVDPEVAIGAQTNAQIVYRVTSTPTHGYLTLNGDRIGTGSIFTQAQVIAGQLRYVHTGSGADQNAADSFAVSVNDGATPQASSDTGTVSISITPVNQAPTAGGGGTIYEGQPRNATSGGVPQSVVGNFIEATGGGDPGDGTLTVRLTDLPDHGTIYFSGTATIDGVTATIDRALTAADLAGSGFVFDYAARTGLTYANDGNDPGGVPPDDSFGVAVTDGGGGTGVPATTAATVTLDIRPVNDDPAWDPASTLSATVAADGPDGTTGTGDEFRVVLTPAMLNVTDVDSPDTEVTFTLTELPADGNLLLDGVRLVLGSTFTLNDVRNGRLVYGQTAANPSGVDAFDTDQFRFIVGDNALSLRWDATGADFARVGGIYDGPEPGAARTTFTFSLSLAETPVAPTNNDGSGSASDIPAPVPDPNQILYVGANPGGPDVQAFSEGGSATILGDDGDSGTPVMLRYTAEEVPTSQIVYTVTGFGVSGGSWSGDLQRNGVSLGVYDTFTQADVDAGRLRFVHDGGEDFEQNFAFQVSAGGIAPDGTPRVTNGVFTFFVTPVNDAPSAGGSTANLIAEGETRPITTAMLSFGDPDDATSEAYLENDPAVADGVGVNFALNNGLYGGDPLQFAIVDLPDHGTLYYDTTGAGGPVTNPNWVPIDATNQGDWRDVAGITGDPATTRLRYVHDGLEVRTDSFQVISRDRWGEKSGMATVAFVITNVNDGPEIAPVPADPDPSAAGRAPNAIGGDPKNDPLTVAEGAVGRIDATLLQGYDPDSTSVQVQYRITAAPAFGRLAYSTDGVTFQTIGVGSAFTQQDVADGHIYYVHNGAEPAGVAPQDTFGFTIADGDKEQAGNTFHILVTPTNDAPTLSGPSAIVDVDGASAAHNPVTGFVVSDPDLVAVTAGETDYVQVTVRLLTSGGTAFAASDYTTGGDTVLSVTPSGSATVDADKNGVGDYLVVRGSRADVNATLATLGVSFPDDRDQVYRLQVIVDDRLRDAGGALTGTANGGPLNQDSTPPGDPTAVPLTEYDWYSQGVPANDPNIVARAVTLRASSFNDPQTLTVPGAQAPYEDTAFTFSLAAGNRIVVADAESSAFDLPVRLTLSVTGGTLTVGSQAGVTVTGNGTGTVVLVGTADDIQARLDAGFSYAGNAQFNGTDTLTVTLAEHQAAIGGDVGSGSVANPDVMRTVALDLVPVNDTPAVTLPAGPVPVGTNVAVAIGGVSISDASDLATLEPGETDFVQATVRLLDAAGNPITDYSGVTLAVAGGATVDATYDGAQTALVLRGTLSEVNTALAGLTVTFDGDRDQTYRLQVLVDDRLRDAGGALVDADAVTPGIQASANGGAVNQQGGLPAVPSTDTFASDPINTATATATSLYNVVSGTVDLHVSSINDAPVNVTPAALTVTEDATNVAVVNAGQHIQVSDNDDFGANLTVVLTASGGTMSIGNDAGVAGDGVTNQGTITLTGSKASLNAVLQTLTFTPTANLHGASGVANIRVQTTDTALAGSSGGNLTDTDDLAIAITAVNDRPTATTNVTLPAFTEDVGNPAGTVISTLGFGYGDATDDQDGFTNPVTAVPGNDTSTPFSYVAIVGDNNYVAGQGTWQVSNGAGGWIAIPTSGLSTSAALIFPSSRAIRFVPAADFHGTPGTLNVRLADGSVDLSGSVSADATQTRNLSVAGGTGTTGAWTSVDRTIGTTVTNVNDRPTGTATTLPATTEDAANPSGATVASLGFGYSDATDDRNPVSNPTGGVTGGANAATAFGGIAVVGNAADAATQGVWQYNDNVGSGWVKIGSPGDGAALLLPTTASLRFVANADFNGTPGGLTVRVSDTAVAFSAGSDITATLADQTSQWSTAIAFGTSVAARNDAPVVTATASNPTVSENSQTGTGISVPDTLLLNAGLTVADLDLTTTAGLSSTVFGEGTITVSFTDAYRPGDVLFVAGALPADVTTAGGNASALTISLDRDTTLEEVKNILEAISYRSTSDNPTLNDTDSDRAYRIVVSDGNNLQAGGNAGGPDPLSAVPITGTLRIGPTNDPPVVDLNGAGAGRDSAVTFNEGANVAHVPVSIAVGATLTDADNAQLTQMVLTVGGVLDGNAEVLSIGGTAFALATDATDVDVGSFRVSYDSGTGVFTIVPDGAGFATVGSFQALLRGITYVNATDDPTAGDRTVAVAVTDAGFDDGTAVGGEAGSNLATATVTVVPANDQPVIGGLDAASFFENALNAAPAVIDGDVTLTDVDSPDYAGGELRVSGLVAGQDVVSLPTSAAAVAGNVRLSGASVEHYDGATWVVVGTASGGNGSNFVVSFNANATVAIAERVVESLTFANTADNPTTSRTLTIAVNDGDGNPVQAATVGVAVRYDNDAPAMSATVLGGTYTEQGAALALVGGTVTVSDPDGNANFYNNGANVGSLTVALDGYQPGDRLYVLSQGTGAGQIGVSGGTLSYGGVAFATVAGGTAADLTITFTSNAATPAAVQALLNRLRFDNPASDDPTAGDTDTARDFTITLNDGGNTRDSASSTGALTATLTGTITVNATPDLVGDSAGTDEDTPVTIDVLANDELGTVPAAISSVTDGVHGKVTDNGDGTVTYTPDADFNGTDTFTYTVTDGNGDSRTATVTVTVSPVVDVAGDTVDTDEDAPVTTAVLANDSFEGTPVVTAVTQGANGTVTVNADNTITYTPHPDFNGTDSYTYTVTSGGVTETATVNVTVRPVVDIADDAETTDEDKPVTTNVLANDSFEGTPVVTAVTQGSNGTVTVKADNTITYTPNPDFNGTDSYTYTVTSGGVTETATVQVTVNPVDDAAEDDLATTDEDTPVTTNVLANDSFEGTPLVTAVTQGTHGTVVNNGDGTVTYTPNPDFNGTDSYTYTVTSGGVTETATVTVTVNPIVDIADDTDATDEDTPVTTRVLANDSFEGTPVVTAVAQGANGTVTVNADNTITYTPNPDFNGTDSYTYTVTSGGVTETATVTVTVNPIVDIADDAVTTDEDAPVTTEVLANDRFGPGAAVTSVTQGAHGSVIVNADNTITYAPDPDYHGTDSYTYTVTSGGVTETATVSVTIVPVVDVVADTVVTDEDTAVTTDVLANDRFAPGASVTAVTQGSHGGVVIKADGTVTYTPDPDFHGTDSYTYTVTTVAGNAETGTVTVTVRPMADAVNDSVSTDEDVAVTTTVLANDRFAPGATITGVTQATHGTVVDNGDGTITYTPLPDFHGSDSYTYTVTTVAGNTETATVTVTVRPVVDIADDAVVTDEDTAVTTVVLANDSFEGTPVVTAVTQGAHGRVVLNPDGTITYTPDRDFHGTDSYTYTVSSGGVTETATVTVTVNPVNDPPVAQPDDGGDVRESQPRTFLPAELLGNDTDVDGDPLTIVAVSPTSANGGTVVLNPDGSVTYRPPPGYSGVDTFTYTISDGRGGFSTATVTVNAIAEPYIAPSGLDPYYTLPYDRYLPYPDIRQPFAPALFVLPAVGQAQGDLLQINDATARYGLGFAGEIRAVSLGDGLGMVPAQYVLTHGVAYARAASAEAAIQSRVSVNSLLPGATTLFDDFSPFRPAVVAEDNAASVSAEGAHVAVAAPSFTEQLRAAAAARQPARSGIE